MFKQGKYEVGMEFIDNAVKYDRQKWQDYQAFIKCILFSTSLNKGFCVFYKVGKGYLLEF